MLKSITESAYVYNRLSLSGCRGRQALLELGTIVESSRIVDDLCAIL